MVLGIGVMHFVGMEAVRSDARLMYRPVTFILSLVVCYVLAVGMDDYISKPITKVGLRGALDRLAERDLLQRSPVAV